METNSLIKQIEQMRDLVSNSRQVQWYEDLLKVAKTVTVSPISEVLSEEQIQYIKDNVQLRKKECYRHATLFCLYIPNSVYVEGQFSTFGLPIEHAFNKVGDKYVDITAELVLGEDVSKLEYISWGEYDIDLVSKIITDRGYYGDIYRQLYVKNLK